MNIDTWEYRILSFSVAGITDNITPIGAAANGYLRNFSTNKELAYKYYHDFITLYNGTEKITGLLVVRK